MHLISTWFHALVKLTVTRFFSSLGALPDFSDSLIEYAYDRQANCDPRLQAYYFECLQVITESRYSEQLQTKVAMLQSQDIVSRRDLSAAYRSLNISVAESKTILDERIIEKYQAQLPDLSAVSQEEARGHLYKIGVARRSDRLIKASRQSVETYEDALNWLGNGVNKDTPDEGILAVFSIKVSRSFLNSVHVA
jgi:ubiquitin carboxyl-terminal hydrolase 25/28